MTPDKNVVRVEYPTDDFDAWVEIPVMWLGEHAIIRDEVIAKASKSKSIEFMNVILALALAIDWGNIPGFEDREDPKKWEPQKTPIALIVWLTEVVVESFNAAYTVPKKS